MSSIDSRIVQMQFDNSQFEKGVSQSLKTLELLKKNLQFDEYEKQLKGLQQSGDSFSLLKMVNSVEEVSQKFSALGVIGKRVLENLTDKAVDAGVKMVKSLSIDQINAGFSRYADKTQAVQTIMAATGEDIGVISEQLNRLAMYTDETSYNFVDMVSNIGKFTSMGVDLKTSVTAMQGISNWAAISGQHAAEAGRAMYNLSQALGMGAVKLMDWKSIENANMGTKEFKETAIETAKALGVLTKAGKTAKGTEVTFQNFRETLNQGWFSNEVLLETLKVYGEYGEEVMRVMAEEGISCAEAMKKVGINTETLGEKAFRAAQEAVTFRQAIEATTDAVSTKWSMIFENIFGNYEEARVTWTNLANELYEIFVEPLNEANDVLSEWKNDPTIQGRTKLIEGLHDAMQALLGIIQAIGDGFSNIFPPVTAETLGKISDKVKEIGMNLKRLFAPKTFQRFTPQKVFKSFNLLGDLEDNITRGMKGADVKKIQKRLNELGANLAEDGIFGPKTEKALNEFKKKYGLTVDGIYDEATHNKLAEAMGKLSYIETMESVGEEIEKYPKGYKAVVGIFTGIAAVVKIVISAFKFLGKVIGTILSVLSPIVDLVFTLGGAFLSAANAISEYLSSGELFNGWLEKINGLIAPVKEEIQSFCDTILEFFGLKPEGEIPASKGIGEVGDSAKKTKKPVSQFMHLINKYRVLIAKTGVFKKFAKTWDTLKTKFKALKGPLKGLWKDFKKYLGQGLTAILNALPGILAKVVSGLGSFASFVIDKVIAPLVSKLPGFINNIRNFFKSLDPNFKGRRSGLAQFFVNVGSSLKSAYESVKTWVGEKWNGIVESVTGLIEQLSPDYEGERSSLAQWLVDFGNDLSSAWTTINEYVGEKWNSIIEGLTTLRAQLDPDYDEEANGERSGIAKFILGVANGLEEAYNKITEWVGDKWTSIIEGIATLKSQLDPNYNEHENGERSGIAKFILRTAVKLKIAYELISKWVGKKWESIIQGITDLRTQLDPDYDESVSGERSGIAKFILSVRDGLRKAWASIKIWVGAKWKSIKDGISNLYTQLDPNYDEEANGERSGIAKFILSVRDGLRKAWASIKIWVGAKWKSIKDGISNLYTQLDPNYDESVSGERSGIAKFILSLRDSLRKAWVSIKTWVGAKWKSIKDGISNLYTQLDPNYDESVSGERSGIVKFILSVRDGLRKAWVSIKTWVGAKWKSIKDGISNLYTQLDPNYDEEANGERSGIAKFILGVASGLESAYTEISKYVGDKWTDIKNWFETEGPSIANSISSFANEFWVAVGVLFSGTGSGENGEAGNNLEAVVLKIRSFLTNLVDALAILLTENPVGDTGLSTDFQKKLLGIRKFISQVFQAIMLLVTGESDKYGLELDDGIRDTILKISGWLKGILDAIKGLFGGGESTDSIEDEIGEKKSGLDSLTEALGGSKGLLASIVNLGDVTKSSGEGGIGSKLLLGGGLLGLGGLLTKVTGVIKDLAVIRGGEDYASRSVPIITQIGRALLALAFAVGVIVVAVAVFAAMDSRDLNNGLAAIQTIFDEIKALVIELGALTLGESGIALAIAKLTNGGGSSSSVLTGVGLALLGVAATIGVVIYALNNMPSEETFEKGMENVEKIFKAISDFINKIPLAAWLGGGLSSFDLSGVLGFAEGVGILAFVATELGKLNIPDSIGFELGLIRVKKIASVITDAMNEMALLFGVKTAGNAVNMANNIWGGGNGSMGKTQKAMFGFIGFAVSIAALGWVAGELSKINEKEWTEGFGRLESLSNIITNMMVLPSVLEAIALMAELFSNSSIIELGINGGLAAGATAGVIALIGGIVDLFFAFVGKLGDTISRRDGASLEFLEDGGEMLGKISEAIGKFIGGFKSGFDKMQNAATDEEISSFGEAITSFANAITGTEYGEGELDSKIDAAIKTAQKIHDFFDGITKNKLDDLDFSKLSAFHSSVSQNNEHIKEFGSALSEFSSALTVTGAVGLAVKVPLAVAAAQQIADFLEQLGNMNIEQKAGRITGLFAKKTTGETVFESVKQLGINLSEAAQALTSVGGGNVNVGQTVGEAVAAVTAVVEFLAALEEHKGDIPDPTLVDEYDAWYGPRGPFQNLMINVIRIGQEMNKFTSQIPSVDTTNLNTIKDGVNALKDIFTGNGSDSFSTDNFLKDFDATAVRTKLSTFVSEVSSAVTDNASTLTESADQFNSSGSGLVDAMAGGMGSNTAANTAAVDLATSAANAAKGKTNAFQLVGNQLSAGLARGISQGRSQVVNAAAEVTAAAIARAKTKAEISSPSRVMMGVGKFFSLGFANGITKYGKAATKSSENMVDSSINTVSGMFNSLSTLADDNIDVQPTIAPVVDMTNIRSASGYMNGVFADRSFGVRTSLMASSIATSAGTATKAGQFGSPDVVSAIHEMNSRIGILGEQISNLKMVVDTGALVGQMAGPMDAKFGTMATMKGRMG